MAHEIKMYFMESIADIGGEQWIVLETDIRVSKSCFGMNFQTVKVVSLSNASKFDSISLL